MNPHAKRLLAVTDASPSSPAGRLLRGTLARAGYANIWGPLSEVAFSSTTIISPGLPTVVYGDDLFQELAGVNLKKEFKATTLNMRGSAFLRPDDGWGVVSIPPASIMMGGGKEARGLVDLYPMLALDAKRAEHVFEHGPSVPQVRIARSEEVAHLLLQEKDGGFISIDIEGTAENPKILGVGWEVGAAYAIPWDGGCVKLLNEIFMAPRWTPIFHNAAYDVAELQEIGAREPKHWVDTMILGAVVNPSIPKNLQQQTLTYVDGTVAWKGIPNHNDIDDPSPHNLRWQQWWAEMLGVLGMPIPKTQAEWYLFYNGLDVDYTLQLAYAQRKMLESQGRVKYYRELILPLQRPLLDLGRRGLPLDERALERHAKACLRLERMAKKILNDVVATNHKAELARLEPTVEQMQEEITLLKANKEIRKQTEYSRWHEYDAARKRIKDLHNRIQNGFNADSITERKELLYENLQLPLVRNDTGGVTTNEKALNSLASRLERGTIGKKDTRDMALRVIKALIANKKWATWRRNFLSAHGEETSEEE